MGRADRVKVYLDLVWLLNYTLDFLLLWMTASLLRMHVRKVRVSLAAMIGASYVLFLFLPGLNWLYTYLVKILFAAIMVYVAFGFRNLVGYIRALATFYMIAFVVAGGIVALHYAFMSSSDIVSGVMVSQTGGFSITIVGSVVLIGFAVMLWFARGTFASVRERQQFNDWYADVHIEMMGKAKQFRGLIDTGNRLADPISRTPVMIVEAKHLKEMVPDYLLETVQSSGLDDFYAGITSWEGNDDWQQKLRLVPYRGVNGQMKMMVTVRPDRVTIAQKTSIWNIDKVLIGLDGGTLSKDGDYQAIIHPSLMLQQSS